MKYEAKILQHLGIVSGVCKKTGIATSIDSLIVKPGRKVSVGTAVEAMILNALGFSNKALYLTPRFYENRPVEHLLGQDTHSTDLHDDCLGTALDALYEYGVTELFYSVASGALSTYGIKHRYLHLDTTSFSLHGRYDVEEPEGEQVIKITKGYSKDNNPDLNQVVLSLMCSYRSNIPVWLEVLSGNSSDKKSFIESIESYKKQFSKEELPYMVADSALYSKEGLSKLAEVKWVTRIPETLKEAKEAIDATEKEKMSPAAEEGYFIKELKSEYADIPQRWLVVFSQKAYDKQYATLVKNIQTECQIKDKEFWHLSNSAFACEEDAHKAAKEFIKTLKYHSLSYTVEVKNKYEKKGRPDKNEEPIGQAYFLSGSLVINAGAVGSAQKRKGFFIIATNELSKENITNEQLLSIYKSQGVSVERGFRFLKDPLFYAESLYLKSPKRIMALLMVMGLSLLIYALAEKQMRTALAASKATIPDQKGKPTATPTLRWVFQIFEGVLLLNIHTAGKVKKKIMNMKEEHKTIIEAFGLEVKKLYFL